MFDANNALQLVAQQLELQNYRVACQIADQAITQFRNNGYLLEIAGQARYGLTDYEQAMARFESAASLIPLATNAKLRLANCYIETGNPVAANAVANELAGKFFRKELPSTFARSLVQCLCELKKFDAAAKICEQIFHNDPTNGHACYGVAWYRSLSGVEICKSLSWFEQAVQLQPENARYRISLGYAYSNSFDIAAAIQTFNGLTPSLVRNIKCRWCLIQMIEFLDLHDPHNLGIKPLLQTRLVAIEPTHKRPFSQEYQK